MTPSAPDIARAIEELSASFLGRFGIVAISDGEEDGREVIEVFVSGEDAGARAALPQQAGGFPVKVRHSGRVVPQAGA